MFVIPESLDHGREINLVEALLRAATIPACNRPVESLEMVSSVFL